MNLLLSIILLLISFLIGSIPTAYLMGRIRGIDIRRCGSGNVGATNAFRTLGKGMGISCLVIDMAKGLIPAAMLYDLMGFANWPPDGRQWAVGIAAILGHMFSPFLGFRGGKGVATSLGVMLAIAPLPMLIVFLVGAAIIWMTGYVSLASMTGAGALPLLILILEWHRRPWITVGLTVLLAAIIIWKHRSNWARLRAGTEKRIFDRPSSGRAAS